MNVALQPGAVYVLPMTAEALGTVLNALAGRPYAEVAPLMMQISAEIGRQNQEAEKRRNPVQGTPPPAPETPEDPAPPSLN